LPARYRPATNARQTLNQPFVGFCLPEPEAARHPGRAAARLVGQMPICEQRSAAENLYTKAGIKRIQLSTVAAQ